jgi:hypothetical protein
MDDVERVALIEETVAPVVGDHGLELVDLDWRGLRPRGVLRLYVDKPGGVGVGDCERLSRELGDVLDAAAVIEGADLEVSSRASTASRGPGLGATGKQVAAGWPAAPSFTGAWPRSAPSGWCWTGTANEPARRARSRRNGWGRGPRPEGVESGRVKEP